MLGGQSPLASRTCGTMKTPQSRTARAAASEGRSTTAAVKRSSADALPVVGVDQSFSTSGQWRVNPRQGDHITRQRYHSDELGSSAFVDVMFPLVASPGWGAAGRNALAPAAACSSRRPPGCSSANASCNSSGILQKVSHSLGAPNLLHQQIVDVAQGTAELAAGVMACHGQRQLSPERGQAPRPCQCRTATRSPLPVRLPHHLVQPHEPSSASTVSCSCSSSMPPT
jgi:hypothetical protein